MVENVDLKLPKDWYPWGSGLDRYEMGLVGDIKHSGKKCAMVRSISFEAEGFGTLMQRFAAGQYCGKRVRMTAWLKCKDVENWCGLWMRVDVGGLRSFGF